MNRQQIQELAAFYVQQVMSWAITCRNTSDPVMQKAAREQIAFLLWILESVN